MTGAAESPVEVFEMEVNPNKEFCERNLDLEPRCRRSDVSNEVV